MAGTRHGQRVRNEKQSNSSYEECSPKQANIINNFKARSNNQDAKERGREGERLRDGLGFTGIKFQKE